MIGHFIVPTQRDIARRTGLSVGGVNLLLKKMVRKGLVKLEKVNGRSLQVSTDEVYV